MLIYVSLGSAELVVSLLTQLPGCMAGWQLEIPDDASQGVAEVPS
jgi:hypothetical protein